MCEESPPRWSAKPLGELAQIVSGGTPARTSAEFWDGGTIAWATPTDITGTQGKYISETAELITDKGLRSCSASLLPPGTILMTSRATLGEAKISKVQVCTNQGFKSLIANPGVSNEFLYYQIQRTKAEYSRFGSGSTFLEVGKKDTAAFTVLIPEKPLQDSIVKILDLIDTQIEAREALIAKQERLRAGLMQDLFTRGVDENGELRPARDEAQQLYHETELGWLPKGWAAKSVSDCVDSISDGPFGSNLKSEHYVTEPGVRVIRLQNIQTGFFDATDQAFVSDDHARYLARFEVRPNDVLIASLGDDRFEAGRACLYPDGLGPAINKADCFRARAAQDVVSPYFLMCALNSEHARRGKLRLIQGVTRQRINTGNYKALVLPIPDPRSDEQSQIVRLLQKAEVAHNEVLDALLELRRLKSGLMQDLLTGMVSVEPLLEKEPA